MTDADQPTGASDAARRHARLSEIFVAALERPEAERPGVVRDACAGDGALEREVLSLLAAAGADMPVALSASAALDGLALHDAMPTAGETAGTARAASFDVAGFHVLRVLGEGGMGTVYEAEQERPRRRVALKVIRGLNVSADALRRFGREADILGGLQHPGICQVHEVGRTESGDPFIAMELVEGRPLDDFVREAQLGQSQRLALASRICDAVAHAHERDIVHRDLKPDNILVTRDGQPKILDFGIARATSISAAHTMMTSTGAIVGTTSYMSPEQAAGVRDVDQRSDVFSLGIVIFEMLTGRRPLSLDGLTLPQALHVIQNAELSFADSRDPSLRGDLATILSKALDRDPARRYADARGLGDDIRRHLEHEPIVARPPSITYRVVKFTHRYRALVTLSAVAFVALAAATAFSLVQWRHATERATAAEVQSYRASISSAATAVAAGDVQRAGDELARAPGSLRGWEADHLQAAVDEAVGRQVWRGSAIGVELAQDGGSVFTASLSEDDGELVHLAVPGGEVLGRYPLDDRPLVVPAAGLRLAISAVIRLHPEGDAFDVIDAGSGASLRHVAFGSSVRAVYGDSPLLPVVSPNSDKVALRGGMERGREDGLCDLSTGTCTVEVAVVTSGAFSADGSLLFGAEGSRSRILDVDDGSVIWERELGNDGLMSGAFAPDGTCFYTAGHVTDRTLRKWSLPSGELLAELKLEGRYGADDWGFTSDGGTIVVSSVGGFSVVNEGLTTELARRSTPPGVPWMHVAITPDGRFVLGAAGKHGMRVYDLAAPPRRQRLPGHSTYVYSVAFSPDGRRLASGSWDATARTWDAATGKPLLSIPGGKGEFVFRVAWSHDGRRLLLLRDRGIVLALDPDTGATLARSSLDGEGHDIDANPSLPLLAAWSPSSTRLLDDASLAELASVEGSLAASWSPDGSRLAVAPVTARVAMLDGRSLATIWRFPGPSVGDTWKALGWSPDGSRLAVSQEKRFDLLDASDGRLLLSLDHDAPVTCILWTPDGRRIVLGESGGGITFLDAETAERIVPFEGHSAYVKDLAWSPDGRTLASASGDGDVRLWRSTAVTQPVPRDPSVAPAR